MLKTWEKVFFIAVVLFVVALFVFRKELRSNFSNKSHQEQTIDAGDKVKDADQRNKKNKEDKDDDKNTDNEKKD